jgi:hypothetical protein
MSNKNAEESKMIECDGILNASGADPVENPKGGDIIKVGKEE